MTPEEAKHSTPEKVESRLAGLEHNFKILLALILVSLSCSFVALLLALITLLTSS